MEFSITMNNAEFIISSVVGPIVAGVYFTIKTYLSKRKERGKWSHVETETTK